MARLAKIRRSEDPLDSIEDDEKDKSKPENETKDSVSGKDALFSEQKGTTMRETCLIGPGDSLFSIAEKYYQDGNVGWLIADINLTNIKETNTDGKRIIEVQSRQVLELPNWDEVTEFYKRRRPEFDPSNLITIVSENQLDRELINAAFKPLLQNGGTAKFETNSRAQESQIAVNSVKIREPGLSSLPDLFIDLGSDAAQ